MKTVKILKLTGILLIGIFLTTPVDALNSGKRSDDKKAIVLTLSKPIMNLVANTFAGKLDSNEIMRIQKMLGQIDHVTIAFRDENASDYLLKIEPMDDQELEAWMFDQGYLPFENESEMEVSVPWMENMSFATAEETEPEVSVPWMENMHFATGEEPEMEVSVPWMENMRFASVEEAEPEVSVPWMENMHLG